MHKSWAIVQRYYEATQFIWQFHNSIFYHFCLLPALCSPTPWIISYIKTSNAPYQLEIYCWCPVSGMWKLEREIAPVKWMKCARTRSKSWKNELKTILRSIFNCLVMRYYQPMMHFVTASFFCSRSMVFVK